MAEFIFENLKNEKLIEMIGLTAYEIWKDTIEIIRSKYDMDETCGGGGKAWDVEHKFRKGGKTLCALYARKNSAGLMIIFGGDERAAFEAAREQFSVSTQNQYDAAKIFHDGKWVMFLLDGSIDKSEFERLLLIKRKPNKK